ncbi:hypothetical protein INR49_007039 [Caranx melampygus]|nr:hypothetical protein INR49_007039 [Caranx melampygus]
MAPKLSSQTLYSGKLSICMRYKLPPAFSGRQQLNTVPFHQCRRVERRILHIWQTINLSHNKKEEILGSVTGNLRSRIADDGKEKLVKREEHAAANEEDVSLS